MPAITYVSHSGEAHTVDVPAGDSVMEGAVQNGIDGILAECGGNLQCATCHVYVDEGFLGLLEPIKEDENEMLNVTASERKPNSRLSCQIPVTKKLDGLIVRLPPTQK
jgi:2Fe-2S ferredoxin